MAYPKTGVDAGIADRIQSAISDKKTSILALSEDSGVPYSTLRRSIKASRSLSIDELLDISNALKVHPAELLPPAITGMPA